MSQWPALGLLLFLWISKVQKQFFIFLLGNFKFLLTIGTNWLTMKKTCDMVEISDLHLQFFILIKYGGIEIFWGH